MAPARRPARRTARGVPRRGRRPPCGRAAWRAATRSRRACESCGSLAARVAGDPADLLDRHEDPVPAGERQLEVVALLARAAAAPEHLLVAGDAVVDVDDEVAGRQPLEDVARHDPAQRLGPADADVAEELPVGDEHEPVGTAGEAAVEAALDERHRAGRRGLGHVGRRPRPVAGLARGARRGEAPGPRRARSGRRRACQPARRRRPVRPRAARRQRRLAPAEQVARRLRRHRPSRALGGSTPRSARGSATRRAGPSSRAAAGTSTASPWAGRPRRRARPGARRPGATGMRQRRRCRRARRGRAACPGRGGRDRSRARGARPRPRRRRRR